MIGESWVAIAARTLEIGAFATLCSLPLAVGLGWLLARGRLPLRPLWQATLALPMVVPPVAVGLVLLLTLAPTGPVGRLLARAGIEITFTPLAAVLAAAVVGFPLFVRACEQAFADTSPRYEALARTLGLSRVEVFTRITLPLAARGVLYGAVLAFTRGLGEFGATALVAGILPGRTQTLATAIWARVQAGNDRGALALCAASFVMALVALLAAETWLGRSHRVPESDGR